MRVTPPPTGRQRLGELLVWQLALVGLAGACARSLPRKPNNQPTAVCLCAATSAPVRGGGSSTLALPSERLETRSPWLAQWATLVVDLAPGVAACGVDRRAWRMRPHLGSSAFEAASSNSSR